ncbi:hypothetical protein ACIRBY_02090 [Streptomyces sp. NPDC096136]|uniref:hypothetical protein n=1 Tax=Streptomyces sp. NPDC096136 TaxID=3366076 RepID=UPI00380BEF8A
MNDPSTLAATDHGDRDGLPTPTPEPTDGPLPEPPTPPALPEPPAPQPPSAPPADLQPLPDGLPPLAAGSVDLPGSGPVAPPGGLQVLPAAPADQPGPAGPAAAPGTAGPAAHPEPLRTLLETAATCRPVEEVTALVGLLKDSGRLADPGHDALRAAAVARPVDEVRRMVALLGEHPEEGAEADIALRAAAVGRPIEDVALLATILDPEASGTAPRGGSPTGPASPQAASAGPAGWRGRADRPPAGTAPPPDPAPRPVPVRAAVPVPLPAAADAIAGRAARRAGVLGHVLRWPAAAALLFCGVLHLPGNLAEPPGPGRLAPLAVALVCLPLGALLAFRDTPAVWRGAAVAALAVVALHIVGGVAFFDPLDATLGASYPWAGVAVVLGAGVSALLAGLALTYRPPDRRTGQGA